MQSVLDLFLSLSDSEMNELLCKLLSLLLSWHFYITRSRRLKEFWDLLLSGCMCRIFYRLLCDDIVGVILSFFSLREELAFNDLFVFAGE